MSSRSQQQGFAIALLLWMIAGMSLMVAAVIHFARADIGMAELRLMEARSEALARGAAFLALRDITMEEQTRPTSEDDAYTEPDTENVAMGNTRGLSTKRYQFGSGFSATATIRSANGYVSLNTASENELTMLFYHLGEASEQDAQFLAEGVVAYRSEMPGYRYAEELLGTSGSKRDIYDRVRGYIHPYRSGALNPSEATSHLADFFAEGDASAAAVSANRSIDGAPDGLISFESMYQDRRDQAGGGGAAIRAVTVQIVRQSGEAAEKTIWMATGAGLSVLRASPSIRRPAESGTND